MVKKLTYTKIKSIFESRGFTLLSKEYVNNTTKLNVICPRGHKYAITWDVFRTSKVGCGQCWGNKTLSTEEVKKAFEAEGYTLLSRSIKNSKQKLDFICPNGHEYVIDWNKFQQGKRCGKCHHNGGYSEEEVVAILGKNNYSLLGEYCGGKKRVEALCPKGHQFALLFNSFNSSRAARCPTCFSSGQSQAENNLFSSISPFFSVCFQRDRKVIPPLELDIFIPEANLAIEFCGLYWHSELAGEKSHKYHYDKMARCWEKGIRLITIFEDEYKNYPDVVVSRILNASGKTKERIFARKTKVKLIDNKKAKEFLDRFHLQGYSRAKLCWGLLAGDSLVGVATVSSITRAHASDNGSLLELKRVAFLPGISVVGGASKLFKCVVTYAKNKGYKGIKSYCDMRWGNNKVSVYDKLGFTLVSETKFTPHYIDKNYTYRIRNQTLRKTPEERLTGKTEWELRQEQGYDRIWDCGHRTFTYLI